MNGTIFTLRNLYRDGTICLEKVDSGCKVRCMVPVGIRDKDQQSHVSC